MNDNDQRTDERWLGTNQPLSASLPENVRKALGRLANDESIETLGDWVDVVRNCTGGGAISVDDLCLADDQTKHSGKTDDETYHFLCFYDAVILAALRDEPVQIRTESPDGTEITAEANGEGSLTVIPEEAVFSFGVDEQVVPDGEQPDHATVYRAICPYVKAFPNRDTYADWAEATDAATVAAPLSDATALAVALVQG